MAKTDRTYDARAMLVMVTTMRQLQQIENMVVIAVAMVTVTMVTMAMTLMKALLSNDSA